MYKYYKSKSTNASSMR